MSVQYHFHDAHDLELKIHFALSQNPYLNQRAIECEIDDQTVILRGRVATYYQKQMAQESIRKLSGLRRITNELAVVSR